MSIDMEAFLRELFADPHRETKDDAARLGHSVKNQVPKKNRGLARWDCSCGMYGTARSRVAARDESIAHLRQVVLDARIAQAL